MAEKQKPGEAAGLQEPSTDDDAFQRREHYPVDDAAGQVLAEGLISNGQNGSTAAVDDRARAYFHRFQHTRLPYPLAILATCKDADGKPLLTRRMEQVLFALLRYMNWREDRQGGLPATWVSDDAVAREIDAERATVTRAIQRLVSLGIWRTASSQEKELVLSERKRALGRPPRVLILGHPDQWNVPQPVLDRCGVWL